MTRNRKNLLLSTMAVVSILTVMGGNSVYATTDKYVEEWKELDRVQTELLQRYEQETDVNKKAEIWDVLKANDAKMQELEQKNIELYQIPTELRQELDMAAQKINDFATVDDSPVQIAYTNAKYRSVFVYVDPAKASISELNPEVMKNRLINNVVGTGTNLQIKYDKIELTACTSKTSNCSPLIGGIEIGTDESTIPVTLGFKAEKDGVDGFVIAGHTVDDMTGVNVDQPDPGNSVGESAAIGDDQFCDCAWVESTRVINDEIYKNSHDTYDIVDRSMNSEMTEGEMVKIGALSGTKSGELESVSANTLKVDVGTQSGDSGSPIFKQPSSLSNDVHAYGIAVSTTGFVTFGEPWEFMQSEMNLD